MGKHCPGTISHSNKPIDQIDVNVLGTQRPTHKNSTDEKSFECGAS